MENLDTFYEKQAVEHEGRPLIEVAWCPGCEKHKPLSRFKRFLTTGEAKARGLPMRPKTEVETRQCNLCRPARTTPRKEQTNTQLRKSVERGDIPEYVAQKLMEERAQMAIPAMRDGAKKRLENAVRREWDALIDGLALEVQAIHMQKNYAKRQTPAQADVVKFCDEYMGVLKDVRSRLRLQARRASLKPQFKDWRESLREYDLNIVRAAWAAVSGTKRKGGIRRPKLFDSDLNISEFSTAIKTMPPVQTKPTVEKPATDWSAIPWEDM